MQATNGCDRTKRTTHGTGQHALRCDRRQRHGRKQPWASRGSAGSWTQVAIGQSLAGQCATTSIVTTRSPTQYVHLEVRRPPEIAMLSDGTCVVVSRVAVLKMSQMMSPCKQTSETRMTRMQAILQRARSGSKPGDQAESAAPWQVMCTEEQTIDGTQTNRRGSILQCPTQNHLLSRNSCPQARRCERAPAKTKKPRHVIPWECSMRQVPCKCLDRLHTVPACTLPPHRNAPAARELPRNAGRWR